MIPLRHNIPRLTFPAITVLLILANTAVFAYQVTLSDYGRNYFVLQNGMIPSHVTLFLEGRIPAEAGLAPFLTSLFLHGGWLHLIGNMWFLWIFGPKCEDSFGHFPFLVFYLICGLTASVAQFVVSPLSQIPTIGASGAIAGVMGAFLFLYPRAKVLTLIPFFFYFTMEIPAAFMLVYWFVIQFFSGVAGLGSRHATGGVAFWAHVGGFIAGLLLVMVFRRPTRVPREPYYYYNR